MDCRTDESCNLKRKLGLTLHDVINTKEQTVINSIKDEFEGENMQTQYTFWAIGLNFIFININLQLKVMN